MGRVLSLQQRTANPPHLLTPQQKTQAVRTLCRTAAGRAGIRKCSKNICNSVNSFGNRSLERQTGIKRQTCCQATAAGAQTAAAAPDDQIPPWRQVVAVTAGCLLLCNLHRSTFAVLLPDLSVQLGLTASQAGTVQASMLAAYLAGQVPAGRLADKYSGTRVLLWGLALWSLATALTAAAGAAVGSSTSSTACPLAVIVLSRVLMGLASACAMPCVTATAVSWVPAEERASMISFVYANFNVGGVIGLTMVPLLADVVGGSEAFVVSGGLGVVWAIVGAVMMRQVHVRNEAKALQQQQQQQPMLEQQQQPPFPAHHQQQQQQQQPLQPMLKQPSAAQSNPLLLQQLQEEEEEEAGQQQLLPPEQHAPGPQQQLSAKEQLSWTLDDPSRRQVLLLCFAHAVIGYGFFLLQNWMPLYVASLGSHGLAVTGRLSSMPWLAAAVVGMLAGSAADGLIRNGLPTLFVRQVMQAVSFLGCGLSVIPLALSPNPGLMPAVLCLTANLTFYSLSYGGFHAYLQDVCGRYAGVLQGVTNSASILMGMFGSLLTGIVVDATGSYSAVFWLLAVMYVGAAWVWCLFTSSYQLRAAHKQV